jgi:serine phosphatase RsbU (regulator of sigma subunit)
MKNRIFVIAFFCILQGAWAQNKPIQITEEADKYIVGPEHLSIFEDKSRFLTVRKALEQESNFLPSKTDKPNYGYSSSAFFAKFSVRNTQNSPQEIWIEVDYPLLDSLDFYAYTMGGSISKEFRTGDLQKFSKRDINSRNFVFSLRLEPQEEKKILLRIATESTVSFPIIVWKPQEFLRSENTSNYGFGLYYGMMMVMLLYNLFIYTVLKERSYLFYILNILAIVFFQLVFNGVGFQYLWGGWPGFNSFNMPLFASLLTLASVNFAREFLDTQTKQPIVDKIFIGLIAIASLLALLSLLIAQRIALRIATFMVLPSSLMILYAAMTALRKGYRPARFFVIAWLVYVVGALMTALRAMGILPTNFVTTYAIQIGSALEVVLLSLALADKINTLRREIAERALEKERMEKEKEREQREFIAEQNKKLELLVAERTKELAEQNKQITDSIHYAQRIQKAILPSKNQIVQAFPEAFIYFKPRDIVSGDFYWFAERDNKIIVAVVDCTGHGVPGAFMSMIGNTLLNQIVLERGVTRPAEILNQLHEEVRFALKQDEILEEGAKDGMDISICVFHQLHNILEFAGANHGLYLIRNNQLDEIKGDRMGIGGAKRSIERNFTNHIIKLGNDEALVYLASDGFADQFGGEDNKKFMARNLKNMLIELSDKPLKMQHLYLNKVMEEWKGTNKQIDDQLIIGFKISPTASRKKAEVRINETAERKSEIPHKFTR